MFNIYKYKFFFEMPWLIWQAKLWDFRGIQIRKIKVSNNSDYIA